MSKALICGWFLSSAFLFAQTNTVVGGGHAGPAPVSVAPGEILTFFVDGLGISLTQPMRAPSGPLPTTLAGINVTLRQATDTPVPIIEVRPVSTCPHTVTNGMIPVICGGLIAITVQIPYEAVALCPLCASPIPLLPTQLLVSVNGHTGVPFELNALADEVHIVTSCDVLEQPFGTPPPFNNTGLPCSPMVTHADGSLVSASAPAKIGETLTAWAFGLGQTSPAAITGQPAADGAPVAETFFLDFNYTVNALPIKPYIGRPDVKPPKPIYAGLAPGFAGLYQINFTVPPQPAGGTPLCALPGTFGPGANAAQSNLTVSVGGAFSFDGAGICVATQIPVD